MEAETIVQGSEASREVDERDETTERGTIVLVTRNNLHLTKLAVKSALAQDMECDVWVVDNASSDGTRHWLNAKHGIWHTSFMDQQSLAYCWNHALINVFRPRALGRGHALVCNNDIELRPDAYRLLLAHGGPFVTCVSVGSRDQVNYPSPPTGEQPHPDMSCFLIRKEVVDTVGYFDEEYYPAYSEDLDMHVRMHRAGIRAVSIDLPVYHERSSTLKSASESEKIQIERGAERGRDRFKQKWGCRPMTPEYDALFDPREFGRYSGATSARTSGR